MYDAIIVGARCAGSATALLLARKNYKVLVVDRAAFPSDTLSGHYIQPAGMAILKRWGIFDEVTATDAPLVFDNRFNAGDFALVGTPPPLDGISEGYCPRRYIFDKILSDLAVDAGAELREGFFVDELIREDGAVVGLRGRERGGPSVEVRAPIVIGADGMHSFVARTVGAATYNEVPARTCAYYSYWDGIPINYVDLYPRKNGMIVALPTNDEQTLIVVISPKEDFAEFRSDIESNYLRAIEQHAPGLYEMVRSARRSEKYYGTGSTDNFFRNPYGPGWALVGDAGYHKDPITGQGMTDAFRDAELLADAIDDAFLGVCEFDEALAEYERKRNEAVMPMYEMTCEFAALQAPPPDMQDLFRALKGNQPDTDRFMGLIAGTVSIPEFYSPENIELIMERAGRGVAAV